MPSALSNNQSRASSIRSWKGFPGSIKSIAARAKLITSLSTPATVQTPSGKPNIEQKPGP